MLPRIGLFVLAIQLARASAVQEVFTSSASSDDPVAPAAGNSCSSRTQFNTVTVPSIDWQYPTGASGSGGVDLRTLRGIAVDERYADWVDNTGETLLPPTLYEFASTFAADLADRHDVHLGVYNASRSSHDGAEGTILLTVDTTPGRYLDVAGRETAEGYTLEVTPAGGVVISGASPLGAWWGTRTLLQLAASNGGSCVPVGKAVDSPGWRVRGVMLDAGRKFYPADYIVELCAYLSYFKQNHFQLHLSDNLVVANTSDDEYVRSLYSAFRLDSDDPAVAGLASPTNESYTRVVFDSIQRRCAARGVTIIPEIEAPGHALPIVKWKPELALASDASMLDISVPETIPAVKQLWSTFLPWIHAKSVHLGADEYNASLPESYNDLVNELNGHIASESGKRVQIWGTFPPKDTYSNNIATNVTITHWAFFEDDPLHDYLEKGYEVINADDAFYVVNKWSESYPQVINKTRIFAGAPDGGAYAPNIFDTRNASNNPPRDDPRVPGQMAAIWNDYGPNGTVYTETYYAWRDNLPALADKQWGGSLTEEQYDSVFDVLHEAVPAQNLDMKVPSQTSTIFTYDASGSADSTVPDRSGNGYDAKNHGCHFVDGAAVFDGECYISTSLERKGRNYTLTFDVHPTSDGPRGSLFSNADSELMVAEDGRLAMMADGQTFSLNYTLPAGEWTTLSLIGDWNRTFVLVNNRDKHEFLTVLGVAGKFLHWAEMAFPSPLKHIGRGFSGMMRNVSLVDYAI